ncbi:MAG: hypothetical protein KME11_19105 [Timaviella obliquedivisa GSE-PSE-MK23-08B]|jgi:hypothetical protein|nr:hypothetical protein [Timaviella obliquedivisa GSE-PSE-MK23-08B]
MLKVMYGEAGLHLECLAQPTEDWIASQAILAVRTAQKLVVERCSASLLLRADLDELRVLKQLIRTEEMGLIGLSVCDAEFVEVSLQGVWISTGDAEAGSFVMMMSHAAEVLLIRLWHESQAAPTPIWR